MTQQPYIPQGYPPQQYAPQYPQAPAPQYPQQAPQQFMPGVQAPPQAPQQPLANGNLDDFFNQPGAGTGPSLSWKDKPIGTTYVGIVARDVTHGDVQQQTDPQTGAPKFFKDGRPQFVMKVPLKVQPSPEFPEGEATYFVRGQARDELVRAMAEAGCDGAPKAGAVIQVTLVQRRPSRGGGNPANVVQITYAPPQGQGQAPQQQAAPVADATSPAPAVASQPPAQQIPQQTQPVDFSQLQVPQQAAPQVAQQVPQQAPVQQQLQLPGGLTPEQQELFARITNQPQQG